MGKSLYQKKRPGVHDVSLVDLREITDCGVEETILRGLGLVLVDSGRVFELKKINPELEPLD
jgi:hypothetical protein